MAGLLVLAAVLGVSEAFTPLSKPFVRVQPSHMSTQPNEADLGFKPWKPPGDGTTNEYGSTDTPDFFDEDDVKGSVEVGAIDGQTAAMRTSLEVTPHRRRSHVRLSHSARKSGAAANRFLDHWWRSKIRRSVNLSSLR